MEILLTVPRLFWDEFKSAMLKSKRRNEEVIGFIVCKKQNMTKSEIRLIPRDYIVPCPSDYDYQSEVGLTLSQEFHISLVNDFLSNDFEMVHIHSHPGRHRPDFSYVDDSEEQEYVSFLENYNKNAVFVSGVFDETFTEYNFRSWSLISSKPICNVKFNVSNIALRQFVDTAADLRLARQEVFGEGLARRINSLHIGLVGCGGLGSSFVDIATRLGVKNWTLVDFDKVDVSNLNRLPNCSVSDVGDHKTGFIDRFIRSFWGRRARVKQIKDDITSSYSRRALSRCDLIVAATDNDYSRLAAQEISSRFVLPLMSLASHVEVSENREMRAFGRISIPPQHGNSWSLISEEIVNAATASMETADEALRNRLRVEGYISDVPAPAVYWVNSQVASFATGLLHRWIIDDDLFSTGHDIILDMVSGQNTLVEHEPNTSCLFSARTGDGMFGIGNSKIL